MGVRVKRIEGLIVMKTDDDKVDSLKKISLLFESGTAPDRMDLTSSPIKYEFILGAGSEGLTPFEYELVNKSIGDEFVVQIHQAEIPSRFEHMASFVIENIGKSDLFYLKVKIVEVSTPDNREVVKALAANAGHGQSCGCGCGCGQGD